MTAAETKIPYLHGVVVRQELAKDYPEVVVAFLKAVIDAGDWVREDPMRAAETLRSGLALRKRFNISTSARVDTPRSSRRLRTNGLRR